MVPSIGGEGTSADGEGFVDRDGGGMRQEVRRTDLGAGENQPGCRHQIQRTSGQDRQVPFRSWPFLGSRGWLWSSRRPRRSAGRRSGPSSGVCQSRPRPWPPANRSRAPDFHRSIVNLMWAELSRPVCSRTSLDDQHCWPIGAVGRQRGARGCDHHAGLRGDPAGPSGSRSSGSVVPRDHSPRKWRKRCCAPCLLRPYSAPISRQVAPAARASVTVVDSSSSSASRERRTASRRARGSGRSRRLDSARDSRLTCSGSATARG